MMGPKNMQWMDGGWITLGFIIREIISCVIMACFFFF
jgi:hypothetical protein